MQIIKNEIMLGDCMDLLAELPDKSIDLAIVDPPYGIGADKMTLGNGNRKLHRGSWDSCSPEKTYFNELFRVSKNQIIWGANHFISKIAIDSSCWIFWDKGTGDNDYADGELAWTSFNSVVKKKFISWVGANAKEKKEGDRFHPTQKPVALYRWLLQNYAKPNDKIIDTHSGSGSLACACHLEKFDFIAIEKDPHYHALSVKRLGELRSQGVLF